MNIQIKQLHPNAILPSYQSDQAAGLDVHACISAPMYIRPQASAILIPLGFALNFSRTGLVAFLVPRSGLGHKKGLVLGNTIGTIDQDYQGEMFASAWNRNPERPGHPCEGGSEPIVIQPGERIAQLIFLPVVQVELEKVQDFVVATKRAGAGFGSTGS